MSTRSIFTTASVGALALTTAGFFAPSTALAAGAGGCDVTCPGGAVQDNDGGCPTDGTDSNGGCNFDPVNYQSLGTLSEGSPINICGTVGGFIADDGTESRDLDWYSFTLTEAATINLSATHENAQGNPAVNFLMFVFNGIDCDTQIQEFGQADTVCPFATGDITLPAGDHVVVFSVDEFGDDPALACPVDYVATLTAMAGEFPVCGEDDAGACEKPNGTPGCDDFECCELVCGNFDFCCEDGWDSLCVDLAVKECGLFIYECNSTPASPPNDCVTEAELVDADSSHMWDTTDAETDGPDQPECMSAMNDEPIHNDIWYEFVAPADGQEIASTCLMSEVDTKIAAYDIGDGDFDPQDLPDLFIACNEDCPDDGEFFTSELTFDVTEGTHYLVRLGDYLDMPGTGTLTLSFEGDEPPPPPDTCDAGGDTPITQNNDGAVTDGGVACAAGGITTANAFARSFDLGANPDTAGSEYLLNCVEFGFDNSGSKLIGTVNAYVDNDGGDPTLPGDDLELLGSREVTLPSGTGQTIVAAFDPSICVPADSVLVVTLDVPASTDGFAVFAGNTAGSMGTTYVLAEDCGINEFTSVEDIGFPDTQWVMTLQGDLGCDGGEDCLGDLDGSGAVDGGDLGILLGAFGTSDEDADLDNSGTVDGGDLGLLLGAFGDCP